MDRGSIPPITEMREKRERKETMFNRLAKSTLEFYERFSYTPNLNAAHRIFLEEVGELIEASRTQDREDIVEEAADVIVTVIGIVLACDISIGELEDAMAYVARKNDRKGYDTHILREGKIQRK